MILLSLHVQKGNENYQLAATSEDGGKKKKHKKQDKDMDELKKEVDLVSHGPLFISYELLFILKNSANFS